jgi:hypothetical protein
MIDESVDKSEKDWENIDVLFFSLCKTYGQAALVSFLLSQHFSQLQLHSFPMPFEQGSPFSSC